MPKTTVYHKASNQSHYITKFLHKLKHGEVLLKIELKMSVIRKAQSEHRRLGH